MAYNTPNTSQGLKRQTSRLDLSAKIPSRTGPRDAASFGQNCHGNVEQYMGKWWFNHENMGKSWEIVIDLLVWYCPVEELASGISWNFSVFLVIRTMITEHRLTSFDIITEIWSHGNDWNLGNHRNVGQVRPPVVDSLMLNNGGCLPRGRLRFQGKIQGVRLDPGCIKCPVGAVSPCFTRRLKTTQPQPEPANFYIRIYSYPLVN